MPTPCYYRMSYQVFLLSDNVQHGLQRVSTSIFREHGQNGEQHQRNRKWNPACSLTPFICLRRADNQLYPSAALLHPSFFLPWPSWPFSPFAHFMPPRERGELDHGVLQCYKRAPIRPGPKSEHAARTTPTVLLCQLHRAPSCCMMAFDGCCCCCCCCCSHITSQNQVRGPPRPASLSIVYPLRKRCNVACDGW